MIIIGDKFGLLTVEDFIQWAFRVVDHTYANLNKKGTTSNDEI